MKSIYKLFLFFALTQSALVFAAGQPFNQDQFNTLMKEGKPIVVHVHAPWCSNCKAQDPIINSEINSPAYKGVTFLELDFDTQKKVLKEFNVSTQSTILVFKQGKEVGRLTGNTKAVDIEALTKKAI
ncbi:thioredoxin family protein [Polynucleobacter sp. CS-Odin-A6]|uniref:thioredoxin family protein n=1 Tax=Polynucleobacter sp. CS-Odin-A6 TaxID=2689106 RepID=UPI001C0DC494|nr:thioredoxin family protein [Polynucleobacter sp. CS-Odin-A6]MBU3621992.1 thioredoxin family protein [Polynucleobacter sp. CS-Odin-A6]